MIYPRLEDMKGFKNLNNCHKVLICLNPDLFDYYQKQARSKARRLKPHIEYILKNLMEANK